MELRKSFEFEAVSVYGMFRVYGPREARAAKPGTKNPPQWGFFTWSLASIWTTYA